VSVTELTNFRNSEERQLCPYGVYVTLTKLTVLKSSL